MTRYLVECTCLLLDLPDNHIASLCVRPTNRPQVHWLFNFQVSRQFRRQGYGRKLLVKACHWADRRGLTLRLNPLSYGDMTNEELIAWYERMGFVQLPAGFYDVPEYIVMERRPDASEETRL